MFKKLFRRKGGEGEEPSPPGAGPRRRQHERIACQIPLRARCSSWQSFRDLFSGNLSQRGLFVPSQDLAEVGEEVELELVAPDGQPVKMIGEVVHVFTGEGGKQRGLGLKLRAALPEQEQLYQALLEEAARQARVKPAPEEVAPDDIFNPPAKGAAAPLFGEAKQKERRPLGPLFGEPSPPPSGKPLPPLFGDPAVAGGASGATPLAPLTTKEPAAPAPAKPATSHTARHLTPPPVDDGGAAKPLLPLEPKPVPAAPRPRRRTKPPPPPGRPKPPPLSEREAMRAFGVGEATPSTLVKRAANQAAASAPAVAEPAATFDDSPTNVREERRADSSASGPKTVQQVGEGEYELPPLQPASSSAEPPPVVTAPAEAAPRDGADEDAAVMVFSSSSDDGEALDLAPARATKHGADHDEQEIVLSAGPAESSQEKRGQRGSEEIPIFLENEAPQVSLPGDAPIDAGLAAPVVPPPGLVAPGTVAPPAPAEPAGPPSQALRRALFRSKPEEPQPVEASAPDDEPGELIEFVGDEPPAEPEEELLELVPDEPSPVDGARPPSAPASTPPPPPPAARGAPTTTASFLAIGDEPLGEAAPAPAPAKAPPPVPSGARLAPAPRSAPVLVGIDFGTSVSSLAYAVGTEVRLVRTPCGRHDVPSSVAYQREQILLGTHARERLIIDPANAITSPKRLLGRRYDERELEPLLAKMAMPHGRGNRGEVVLQPPGRTLAVEDVCASVLAYLRRLAEKQLGQPVRQAVLTVPVSFDQRRCEALERAASLAGLESVTTIDEPTAAALPYASDPSYRELCAVYDFGGGTFDFSVLDVSGADVQVVATAGDLWLGGDDLDEELASLAANDFWRRHGIELRNQAAQWQRLRMAAELAKRELSTQKETVVELRQAAMTSKGPLDVRYSITRDGFAELSGPLIQRSIDTCQEALALCGVEPGQLQAVYLSGGTCYVPAVREAVERFFGKPATVTIPPERAVVMGAAIHAAQQHSSRIAT